MFVAGFAALLGSGATALAAIGMPTHTRMVPTARRGRGTRSPVFEHLRCKFHKTHFEKANAFSLKNFCPAFFKKRAYPSRLHAPASIPEHCAEQIRAVLFDDAHGHSELALKVADRNIIKKHAAVAIVADTQHIARQQQSRAEVALSEHG